MPTPGWGAAHCSCPAGQRPPEGPGAWGAQVSGLTIAQARQCRQGSHDPEGAGLGEGSPTSWRLSRPHCAYSPTFPGSQPAPRGAQHPEPCPASTVQAEGTHVQQRSEPSHAHTHACGACLTSDAHHTPSCHPRCPGTSSGHGRPTNSAPCAAAAQEESVPHGRYAWQWGCQRCLAGPAGGGKQDLGCEPGTHPPACTAERADVCCTGDVQDGQQGHAAREGPHPGLHGWLPRWVRVAGPGVGALGPAGVGGSGSLAPGPPSSLRPPQRTRARSRGT